MLEVFKTKCNQCLYTNKRITSKERADEIIAKCIKDGNYFICHKSTIKDEGKVCCSSFYKKHGDKAQIVQIAKRLNVVKFVKHDKELV